MRAATDYLVLVVALLTFRELTTGFVQKFLQLIAGAAFVLFLFGFGKYLQTHEGGWFLNYNQLLATAGLVVLLPFLASPRLQRKYGVLHDRGVLSDEEFAAQKAKILG